MADKPLSGGKRATIRRHADALAARGRPRDYRKRVAAEYDRVVGPLPRSPADAFEWHARLMIFCCDWAMRDPGISPERARDQISRLSSGLTKALEPARMASRLAELEAALEQLQVR